jgi:TolB-like protein
MGLLTVVLGGLLAASAGATDVKLASPGLTPVNVDARTATFVSDHLAQQLALQGGLSVLTQSEISSLLGFERQKELLGCADQSTSCLAELGGALGVDGIITGNVARLGTGYTLNVKVVAARDGRALGLFSRRVADEDALLDAVGAAAAQLASDVWRTLRPGQARPSAAPGASAVGSPAGGGARLDVVLPAAVSGALLAGSGVFYALARGTEGRLADPASAFDSRQAWDAAVAQGRTQQTVSAALLGAGAISGLVAAGFALWGGPQAGAPRVGALVTPSSASLSVAGVLP